MFCFFQNCKDNHRKTDFPSSKYTYIGTSLIKETFDSTGKITIRQYYNADTVPNGAKIEFYNNGKIASWIWYSSKHKEPYCGVYYSEEGLFDTLRGIPFIDIVYKKDFDYPYIKTINPPNVALQLVYKDIYNGKIVKKTLYGPILTDSVAWFGLDEYKYQNGHKHEIYFNIVDTIKEYLLYQDSLEIIERR
jgi:hypothetical protein